MLYSFSFYHLEEGAEEDLDIKGKGSVLQIIRVKIDLNRYRQFIAAVNLRPAGEARSQSMDALIGSQFDQIVLIEEGRAESLQICTYISACLLVSLLACQPSDCLNDSL